MELESIEGSLKGRGKDLDGLFWRDRRKKSYRELSGKNDRALGNYIRARRAMSSGMLSLALEQAKMGLEEAYRDEHLELCHHLHVALAAATNTAGKTSSAQEQLLLAKRHKEFMSSETIIEMDLIEAELLRKEGRFREALSKLEGALRSCHRQGEKRNKFQLLQTLVLVQLQLGYEKRALSLALRAMNLAERLNSTRFIAKACLLLNRCDLRAGRLSSARDRLEKARALEEGREDKELMIQILKALSETSAARGEFFAAKEHLKNCTELWRDLSDPFLSLDLDTSRALLYLEQGKWTRASSLLQESISTAHELGAFVECRKARALLGEAKMAQGDTEGALSVLLSGSNHSSPMSHHLGLRMAAIHLEKGDQQEVAKLLDGLNPRRLSTMDRLLLFRIKEEWARKVGDSDLMLQAFHRSREIEKQCEETFLEGFKRLAKRLGLNGRPVALLLDKNGKEFLSSRELKLLSTRDYPFFFDAMQGKLYQKGKEQKLSTSTRPGRMLMLLMSYGGQRFTAPELFEYIWKAPFHHLFNNNNVYVTIYALRKLLKDDKDRIMSYKNGKYSFAKSCRRGKWALLLPYNPDAQQDDDYPFEKAASMGKRIPKTK